MMDEDALEGKGWICTDGNERVRDGMRGWILREAVDAVKGMDAWEDEGSDGRDKNERVKGMDNQRR